MSLLPPWCWRTPDLAAPRGLPFSHPAPRAGGPGAEYPPGARVNGWPAPAFGRGLVWRPRSLPVVIGWSSPGIASLDPPRAGDWFAGSGPNPGKTAPGIRFGVTSDTVRVTLEPRFGPSASRSERKRNKSPRRRDCPGNHGRTGRGPRGPNERIGKPTTPRAGPFRLTASADEQERLVKAENQWHHRTLVCCPVTGRQRRRTRWSRSIPRSYCPAMVHLGLLHSP